MKAMKIKPVLLLGALALLPFTGAAITVECVDSGSSQHPFSIGDHSWDYSYKVTLGTGESIDWFHVGVGAGCTIYNIAAVDAAGTDLDWFGGHINGTEDAGTLVDHDGSVSSWAATTGRIVAWTTFTSSISDGVYYFGFNCDSPEGVFGFLAENNGVGQLVENWNDPVGQGTGPVHSPIPEPATLSLLGVSGVILLFRRWYSIRG